MSVVGILLMLGFVLSGASLLLIGLALWSHVSLLGLLFVMLGGYYLLAWYCPRLFGI